MNKKLSQIAKRRLGKTKKIRSAKMRALALARWSVKSAKERSAHGRMMIFKRFNKTI